MPYRRPLPDHQLRFGAHVSIAGGLHCAFERAMRVGCDCIQVFVKNQRQWSAGRLTKDEVSAWSRARQACRIRRVVAHASYLINLASPANELWDRSIEAYIDELQRCERLGIEGLVIHPGSHKGEGETAGLRRVARAVNMIHRRTRGFRTRTILETTAGQGYTLGSRFEHLSAIIGRISDVDRMAICVDTCHLYAAGYNLALLEGYEAAIDLLAATVGLNRVSVFHVNDSLGELGAKRDRHVAIGYGHLGRKTFARLVNDCRFFGVPMILETPKGVDARGRDLDRVNLAILRRLVVRQGRGSWTGRADET